MRKRRMQVVKEVINNMKMCTDKALPLISALCEKIRLPKIVNEHTAEDSTLKILTTGDMVKAIVMNIVAGKRRPAYKLHEFYEYKDVEKMFGEGIESGHFNDDAVARSLDRFYEAGPKKVMTETAMSIINEFKIPIKSIHADTTSKSLYGEYDEYDEYPENTRPIELTQGHSKDFRPDLKQIIFGLGVTKERIVVAGNVCDGNTSDKTWNKDILKDLRESMKKYGLRDFVYVADSAAVTEEMLKELAGDNEKTAISFVSRLPANYKLEQSLKQKATEDEKQWTEIGQISNKEDSARYKVKSYFDELYGRRYRFIICHSDQLNTKKEKTLQKSIKTEFEELRKKGKAFEKIEYYCEKDALEAVKRFEEETLKKFHIIIGKAVTIEKIQKRQAPGRPKSNVFPEKSITYGVKIKIVEDDVAIRQQRDKEGLFVLVTNILENEKFTDGEILSEYKGQVSVETCFKVLKDPYFMDELFYKKPHRIEALAYIMLISLMVLTLLERTVRENLKSESTRIMVSGKRRTFTPTGLSIIEALENIQVVIIRHEGLIYRDCRLNENIKRLIKLAGFDPEIYTEGYERIA